MLSPRVVGANGTEIAPAANGVFYKILFSTDGMSASAHTFRAIETPHRLILGLPWLNAVNPNIDWRLQKLSIRDKIELADPYQFIEEAEDSPIFLYCVEVDEMGKVALPNEYQNFADVFNEAAGDILPPHRNDLDHAIDLVPGKNPPFGPLYNLSEYELSVLKDYIDKNLKTGYISRSKSPAGAPILFVKKRDGSLRLCVDYRGLNAVSIKNKYPIPLISEILDRLQKARIFTKLDLRGAYNLIRIKEGDEWKTAFRTRYGSYEYRVMPFGLANAPATFQSYINRALQQFLDMFAIVYLDDILIYSEQLSQHSYHVQQVLQALRDNGLFVKLDKCAFSQSSVEYLGFIISPQNVSMDLNRVSTIQDWPTPMRLKEVQAFLGFCNFYRRFIRGYSDLARALTELTKKDTQFQWGELEEKSFNDLKLAFTKAPLLAQFDPTKPIWIETDASNYAVSGIISQKGAKDEHKHPIAFHSRKLNSAERNYGTPDHELLAIVTCFRVWRQYLEGSQHVVRVLTDHNNLRYFLETKQLTRRQAHWGEFLSGFNFIIEYRPGKRNPADAPSRRADYKPDGPDAYTMVPFFKLALLSLDDGREATLTVCDDLQLCELTTLDNQGDDDADLLSHTIVDQIRQTLQTDKFAKEAEKDESKFKTKDGLLYYEGNRLYIPDDPQLKLRILQGFHDSPTAGHFGRDKTIQSLQRWFYWPDLVPMVTEFVSTCEACCRSKQFRHLPHGELLPLPAPGKPWTHITVDFITDLPKSREPGGLNIYNCILVVIDRFTKMAHYIPTVKELKAKEFAHLMLREVIKHHNVPEVIVSDRGTLFTSDFWMTLIKQLGSDHRLSTAFHPQTDGQTERQNQTLEHYLRCYCDFLQTNWAGLLPLAEWTYNAATHSVTGLTPFYAYTGRNPVPFQLHPTAIKASATTATEMAKEIIEMQQWLQTRLVEAQDVQARYYDRKHKRVIFKLGDRVWLATRNLKTERPSRKLDNRKLGPFEITRVINEQAYQLKLPESMKINPVFHVSLLSQYKPNTLAGRTQPPPPPIGDITEGNDNREWEVEAILKTRFHYGKLQYYVKWLGYDGPDGKTWQTPEDVANAHELVTKFHEEHPMLPGPE